MDRIAGLELFLGGLKAYDKNTSVFTPLFNIHLLNSELAEAAVKHHEGQKLLD